MKHQITTLPNGLRVVTAEMADAQSLTAAIVVGVGSRYEDPSINGGVTHFLEHLFFKGTAKRPSTKIISEQIDAVGGYNNAYTSEDVTNYYVKVPKGKGQLALDILADMMTGSLFDPKEVDRERGTVIEEINMYEDNPASSVHTLTPLLLWPDHPLGHKVLGTKEVISTISRDDIVAYKNSHYGPHNMVVAAAGAVKHDEVVKWATDLLGGLEDISPIEPVGVGSHISDQIVKSVTKDTAQTHLAIASLAPALEHEDHAAARLATAMLGRGLSSRLFINVRERKGLAYAVNASLASLVDTGQFEVYAGVNTGKVSDAIEAILEELANISTEEVSEKELDKAKNQLSGGLRMALETNNYVADRLGTQLVLLGKIKSIEQAIAEVEAVTVADVRRVAAKMLAPEGLRMGIITPDPARATKTFEKLVGV